MVDLTSPKQGPLEVGFNNYILMIAGIILFGLIGLFSYRLIQSYQERERKREEKRKLKEEKSKKKK